MLQENFTRHFGVWRESEAGRTVTFDPLFPKGAALPGSGPPPIRSRAPILRFTTSDTFDIWNAATGPTTDDPPGTSRFGTKCGFRSTHRCAIGNRLTGINVEHSSRGGNPTDRRAIFLRRFGDAFEVQIQNRTSRICEDVPLGAMVGQVSAGDARTEAERQKWKDAEC